MSTDDPDRDERSPYYGLTPGGPVPDSSPGRHAMSGDEQPAATPGDDPTPAVHSDQWVPPESVRPAAPAVPVPSTAPVPPRDPVPPKDPVHPATAASSPTDGGVMTDVVASGTGQPDSDASPKKPARRVTGRRSSERRLAYWLIAPAAVVMALVTGYPIVYAFWLSLNKSTLTAPDEQEFVWFSNYATVLSAGFWWSAFGITAFLTLVSVIIELALGLAIALLMHRTIFGKGVVRTVVLIPYGIVTVAAAISWKYAWTTDTGYLANLLPDGSAPLTQQWPSLFIIILAEVWKTTPFMALLLLAGLALVPDDLLKAAQLDGAGAWTRLRRIIIPMMKPAILVALLFRTLDAFRIFDNIYVLTAGSNGTASVSMLGYDNLFKAFNLGVGSAISILIFLAVALIAFVFIKGFGTAAPGSDDEGR